MKDINYFINKMNSLDISHQYTKEQKESVAKYFYDLFDKLSKMYITEDNQKRQLSELEQFLFMYVNITSIVKDHNENWTSHDVIGAILTQQAVCQGYTLIMQLICHELKIPFLYKKTEGPLGAHGNFQVNIKDNKGITHCLHCDPYIDAPENEEDTITFNATLISANDMNNYHNKQEQSSEFLFWEIVYDKYNLEDKKTFLDTISFMEQFRKENPQTIIENHYESLKNEIQELSNFFQCEIGNLETKEDILNAYQTLKDYYQKLNLPIAREELYDILRQLYISYNEIFLEMPPAQAISQAEETITRQIENTDAKHQEKWNK